MKIIFDLDGTIIDVSERHYQAYKRVVGVMGGQSLEKATYWQLKKSQTTWPDILTRSRVTDTADFLNRFVALVEAPELFKLDVVFENALPVLKTLHDGDHELYLVSLRRHDERLKDELDELGLTTFFTKIISDHTDGEGHHLKTEIIKDLVGTDEAIVIGDTEADVLAAQRLGLRSVAVCSGIRSKDILEKLQPDYILNDIGEIMQIPELAED
jgi:phosphoglycolate phosphatase